MLSILAYMVSGQSLATIVFSDPTNNLPEIGENFNVPVNVAGFTDPVRYIEIVLEYNTEALLFTEVTNLQNPSCMVNVQQTTPGTLVINYNQMVLAFNVSDEKLFDIQFDYLEGSSDLIFWEDSHYREGSLFFPFTDVTHGGVLSIYLNNHNSGGAWENPGNWSKGLIPDGSHNVFIQGVASIDSEAACNNLTIEINQQLSIAYNGSLTVNGTLTTNAGINGLFLESATDGTASLIHGTPEVRATMQQFMFAPEMAMHQIS